MIEQMKSEWMALYRRVNPSGERIPVKTDPFSIKDSIPLVENIKWEVGQLWRHQSGWVSCMRVKLLQ